MYVVNTLQNKMIYSMTMKNFDLETKVQGKPIIEYMANLIEKNEKQEIEIERGKLSVSILKQMNNRSRLLLDAAKYELKRQEFDLQQTATS